MLLNVLGVYGSAIELKDVVDFMYVNFVHLKAMPLLFLHIPVKLLMTLLPVNVTTVWATMLRTIRSVLCG